MASPARKDVIEPGKESVWDYPRPPRLEDCTSEIEIVFEGETIVRTSRAKRVLETSHPPVYYIPIEDVRSGVLRPSSRRSFCEWKGVAHYFDVKAGDHIADGAAWGYDDPGSPFEGIRNHVAFYAHLMDRCYVDGEAVQAQEGNFYGGWITSNIIGPFKGGPGTRAW
jgi:uncharacterized protein (DUF427 family)